MKTALVIFALSFGLSAFGNAYEKVVVRQAAPFVSAEGEEKVKPEPKSESKGDEQKTVPTKK